MAAQNLGRQWIGIDISPTACRVMAKQKDKVGRPDIDAFEAVLAREKRTRGFFVAFDYSQDVEAEIGRFVSRRNESRFLRDTGIMIHAYTVADILEGKTASKLV